MKNVDDGFLSMDTFSCHYSVLIALLDTRRKYKNNLGTENKKSKQTQKRRKTGKNKINRKEKRQKESHVYR